MTTWPILIGEEKILAVEGVGGKIFDTVLVLPAGDALFAQEGTGTNPRVLLLLEKGGGLKYTLKQSSSALIGFVFRASVTNLESISFLGRTIKLERPR
jgi:hypothetical protein